MTTHPRAVIAVWLVVLALCGLGYPVLESRVQAPDLTVDRAESVAVQRLIAERFPSLQAEQALLVFDSDTAVVDTVEFRAQIERARRAVESVGGMTVLAAPTDLAAQQLVSADGRTALAVVAIEGDQSHRVAVSGDVQEALSALPDRDVVRVDLTGYTAIQNDVIIAEQADARRAESLGVPVAFVLLTLALGAVAAASLPILMAVAGLLTCTGVLLVASTVTSVDPLMLSIAGMIGLGVGIDYALFVVSRFREELSARGVTSRTDTDGIRAAVTATMATTGGMVLASGSVVIVSLSALIVVPAGVFRGIVLGVGVAVATAMLAAVTLLPAVLTELGPAVNRWRVRGRSIDSDDSDAARRWARRVMRRPVAFGLAAAGLLVVAALPLSSLRTGFDLGIASLTEHPSGVAAHTVAEKFPPGMLSPMEFVATGPEGGPLGAEAGNAVQGFADELRADPRVAAVLAQQSDGRVHLTVVTRAQIDSAAGSDLVAELDARALAASDANLRISAGGAPAGLLEISDAVRGAYVLVVVIIVLCALALLVAVFRSVAVPVKAVAVNLLATAAALGITVVVFQWGWGEALFGFESPGFVQVVMPLIVFVILFGLSMDYEVFVIRRIRETWDGAAARGATDPVAANQDAVADGIGATAKPVAVAAAIMVVVFACFLTASTLELKQLGFALAVAVLLDVVVVRLVLVPATLRLLGRWNWWLPAPVQRKRTSSLR
ncbi:MMPL family transporter [Nocardia xishanensis]|uniref:MMPL family transporter n=1 Tax=Nocardia xishanensis TaxID=238964 RepID=A0ABW7WTE5_9NOCA